MPTSCNRLSSPSLVKSGASSWHGTHHDAQTLTTLTLPLNTAGSSPGTCAPLLTRPSSGGSAVWGAGRPMSRAHSSDVHRASPGAPANAAGFEFAQMFFLTAIIERDPNDQNQNH